MYASICELCIILALLSLEDRVSQCRVIKTHVLGPGGRNDFGYGSTFPRSNSSSLTLREAFHFDTGYACSSRPAAHHRRKEMVGESGAWHLAPSWPKGSGHCAVRTTKEELQCRKGCWGWEGRLQRLQSTENLIKKSGVHSMFLTEENLARDCVLEAFKGSHQSLPYFA